MTRRKRLRMGLMGIAAGLCVATAAIWWADGAWENGAIPTHGLIRVAILAGFGLLCIFAAAWLDRARVTTGGHGPRTDPERSPVAETGTHRAVGLRLRRFATSLIPGIVFFAIVTPIAWVLRLRKKDVIALDFEPERESYWIERQTGAPGRDTMRKQF